MGIEQIGFDDWFREKVEPHKLDGFQPARVVSISRNTFWISDGSDTLKAELTGRFMFKAGSPLDFPAVGDWVCVQVFSGQSLAVIHDIFPRKNLLKRKMAGKRVEYQLIAANLDAALIVQALDSDFNLRRLERYLVMVNDSGIMPLVLLSKSDLLAPVEIEKKKSEIRQLMPDIGIIALNCIEDSGLDDIERELLPGRTYCLLGSSGVGKSTLINRLCNSELLKTRSVRERDGRGRHTTTQRQLIVLDNGAMIIDTPGMRELGNLDVDSGIGDTFADIAELAAQCRYRDCTHTHEDNCAVRSALEDSSLPEGRFESYLKLKRESEYYERSYQEKRERDKKFGKHCKSVMKHKKRERS